MIDLKLPWRIEYRLNYAIMYDSEDVQVFESGAEANEEILKAQMQFILERVNAKQLD